MPQDLDDIWGFIWLFSVLQLLTEKLEITFKLHCKIQIMGVNEPCVCIFLLICGQTLKIL